MVFSIHDQSILANQKSRNIRVIHPERELLLWYGRWLLVEKYLTQFGDMAQTRNTIELLTKILEENGTSKIRAETFRLAKFNDKDAVCIYRALSVECTAYI